MFLAILVGRSCVCIDSILSQGVTVGYSPLSQPLPLHAGTGPRLLLAYLKDEEIERYIALESPLRGFTPTTITDPKALWEEVRLIRKTGFARGYQDFSTGANFLAFPVIGQIERPLGTIVIGGPLFRFTREVADGLIPEIQAADGRAQSGQPHVSVGTCGAVLGHSRATVLSQPDVVGIDMLVVGNKRACFPCARCPAAPR